MSNQRFDYSNEKSIMTFTSHYTLQMFRIFIYSRDSE
nr:MAG TPA: hypothetical protein [Bacteriophage sp.]